jgi:nucleotide-binding universal stress UspA family protein
MKDKHVKTEYDFLVLTDFSDASYIALKYAISLAKLIKSTIHVCHIANPEKIVENDNALMAIRSIELESKKIEKKIGAIIEIVTAEGINVIPHYSIGNIIGEFKDRIDVINPDLVILGRKVENPKLSGKITSYLMNQYKGSLLIVKEDNKFQNDTKISIACNENTFELYDSNLVFSLNNQTKAPIRLLNIKSINDSNDKIKVPQTWRESSYEIDQNIQFEQNSTVLDGLLQHISNNSTELLCIGRGKPRNLFRRVISSSPTTVLDVINKIDIPILVMGINSASIN